MRTCFVPTLLATAAITWLSLTSYFQEVNLYVPVPFYDKWAHFLMYGALTLVVRWDFRRCLSQVPRKWMWWALICAAFPVAWGGLMELAQAYLTTYRSGDLVDVLANSVGVALGLVVPISRKWS